METNCTSSILQFYSQANDSGKELSSSRCTSSPPILPILTSFEQHARLDKKTNILTFWEEHKAKMPELYKLAQIVLAVPATQVSVERLFSGLKFILSPLRCNLNKEILEDILIVRSNTLFINKNKP